jgi:hypothetical protein
MRAVTAPLVALVLVLATANIVSVGFAQEPQQPGVPAQAGMPGAIRSDSCFRYDPTHPQRPITNILVELGQATWGPMGDNNVEFLIPAVYIQVATPGGIDPDAMRVGMLDYWRTGRSSISAEERIRYLLDAEQQAISRPNWLQGAQPGWWLAYCPDPNFDPAQAVTLFMAGAQSQSGLLALLCASQSAERASPGMFKLTVDFMKQIADRQAATGVAFDGSGAMRHLCGSSIAA